MFDPIRAQGDPTGPREVHPGGEQGMGTRRTGYGDTEDERGWCPGAARCSEPTWGCLLGKSGRDNQAQIPVLVREREIEGKKKKKRQKKKRLSFIMRLSAMGGAGRA